LADERRAKLRVTGPDITEDQVEVTKKITIGRLAKNDLTLKSPRLSREHATLEFTADGLVVQDLNSANGTLVNSERIEPDKAVVLKVGDTIGLGPFTLFIDEIIEPSAESSKKEQPSEPAKAEKEVVPKQEKEKAQPPAKKSDSKADKKATEVVVSAPKGPIEPPPPRAIVSTNGAVPPSHLKGIPSDASSWLRFLPEVYSTDAFTGRFLLIFESIFAPFEWMVDNFDLYLDDKIAPPEWLQWFGEWVDIFVPDTIPEARQRALVAELDNLFLSRGTRGSLSRHLELVFDVKPDIDEPKDHPSAFTVTLKLGKSGDTEANRHIATRIIDSQRPAHTQYTLTIE
jgi:phage tail-like protein